jgi:hypothetical protein
MKRTTILVSDGILNACGRHEAAQLAGAFLLTEGLPNGWVADVCEDGVAFHLRGEEGNILCDPSKPGYQEIDEPFSEPKGRA